MKVKISHVLGAATSVVLTTTLLAALSGCGNDGGGGQQDSGSANGLKAYDVNPTPRAEVREGGTLRWGLSEYPTQWNQNHVDGNLSMVERVVSGLMPKPFVSDQRAQISIDHDYLAKAEVTKTSPKQVVTLTLSHKAKWSDGRPITYQDYQAQWQAMNGRNTDYRVATTTGYQDIESVERGDDDYQVVITFGAPFGDWRSLFSPLYPKSTNDSPDAFNNAWLNKIPVTAGPFRFGKFDPTAKTITVVRNESWWGDKAKLDRIVYRSLESDALIGAFTNGELDTIDIGPSAPDYQRAKDARDVVVRQAAGPDYRHFTLNGESEVLSDLNVRRAIALGIDRQAIAQSDLQGLGWPIALLNNHFFMNTQQGYQDDAGDLRTYNPDKAKQLLDAAGWKMSGNVRKKGGKELTLRFVIPSGLQLSKSEGELTQTMLQRIGVKVAIQSVPSDDFFTKYIIPGNYDITPFSYIGTPFPVTSGYAQYANAAGGDKQWNSNLGRIGSLEIDAALRKAAADLDSEDARKKANAADKLIWKAVNVLTLYQRPQNVGVKSSLANIGARGFYDLRYQDIGFTR
jgi:peptide/nickel transport system substrate-binding protein